MWEKLIETEGYNLGEKDGEGRGFTVVEVLVVVSILSVLMAILLPVLGKMRHQARTLQGLSNMREIVNAVNYYALDNANYYPDSVATIGVGSHWNWQEPTMLTGYRKRSPQLHRSMNAYLGEYIKDAKTVFCTNAPEKYKHLKKAWALSRILKKPKEGTPRIKV